MRTSFRDMGEDVRSEMSGAQLRSLSCLGQEAATGVLNQWLTDRTTHLVDSADTIEEILTDLLAGPDMDWDRLIQLDPLFVTLHDGRIIQFEFVNEEPIQERVERRALVRGDPANRWMLLWIGNDYYTFDLSYHGSPPQVHLHYTVTADEREALQNLIDIISDENDQAVEFMDYSRNLMNALASDGAAANAIISTGMNGSLDSIKELASIVGCTETGSRFQALAGFLADNLSQIGSNVEEAQEEDEDNGVFDPATYSAVKTVSLVAGAWSVVSGAVSAIASIGLVVGGPIVKTISAVAQMGVSIANQITNKIASTEYAQYDPSAQNLAFANAIRFRLPINQNHRPISGDVETLASYNSCGAVMMQVKDGFVEGLIYPNAGNGTRRYDLLDSDGFYSAGSRNGVFAVGSSEGTPSSLSFGFTSAGSTAGANAVITENNEFGKVELQWAYGDTQNDQDARQRDQVAGNLMYQLYKLCSSEFVYSVTENHIVSPSEAEIQGWSLSRSGSSAMEVLIDILTSGDTTGGTTVTTEFDRLLTGCYTCLRLSADDNDIGTGVLYALKGIAPAIMSRGLATKGYGVTSSSTRLSWTELETLMDRDITFEGASNIQSYLELHGNTPWYRLVGELGDAYFSEPGLESFIRQNVSPAEAIIAIISCILSSVRSAHYGRIIHYNGGTAASYGEVICAAEGEVYSVVTPVLHTVKWFSPGDGSFNDSPVVYRKPMLAPPKFKRGTILASIIITAVVAVAAAVTAVIVRRKIRNHQKVKVMRREADATAAAEALADAQPGTPEYKEASKQYIKAQKRFQRYASRVGYSSNSVGSFSSGSILDALPSNPSDENDGIEESMRAVISLLTPV